MMKIWQRLGLALCLVTPIVLAVPKADLWPTWNQSNETNAARIDHHTWQQFLNKYLVTHNSGPNLLKYKTVTPADKQRLFNYLKGLAQVNIREYQKAEQAVYWLNLYNALTVNLVLDNYPVSSIKQINLTAGVIKQGPWDNPVIRVNKTPMSLNDIEHRIIRPIWQDSRMHYALNQAALGSPSLGATAYTRDNLEQQLNQHAKRFINSPYGIQLKATTLQASKLYAWYRSDFGNTEQAVLSHINSYVNPDLKSHFSQVAKIDRYFFDWRINEAK